MVIPIKTSTRGNKRFYWDCVLNNYTEMDCEIVKCAFEDWCDAYIIGLEIGKSGTKHLQCMVKLKKGNYKSYILGLFKNTCVGNRISIREGRNIDAMKNYCLKDGNIFSVKNIDRINKVQKKVRPEVIFEMIRKSFEKEAEEKLQALGWHK